ncbi:hypothetical protein NPIL_547881 [Nephila pilipes]|uniref:Uncharacterized protein n=1 Tax=Nephila pilipes TaxID=299642 RepID=A0A8X6PQT8_NEPPI|nr:hypothetical protein NPIL_547881 [Nephila pilipes]
MSRRVFGTECRLFRGMIHSASCEHFSQCTFCHRKQRRRSRTNTDREFFSFPTFWVHQKGKILLLEFRFARKGAEKCRDASKQNASSRKIPPSLSVCSRTVRSDTDLSPGVK